MTQCVLGVVLNQDHQFTELSWLRQVGLKLQHILQVQLIADALQSVLESLLFGERVGPPTCEAGDFRGRVGLAQASQFPQAAEDIDAHRVAGERLAAGERSGGARVRYGIDGDIGLLRHAYRLIELGLGAEVFRLADDDQHTPAPAGTGFEDFHSLHDGIQLPALSAGGMDPFQRGVKGGRVALKPGQHPHLVIVGDQPDLAIVASEKRLEESRGPAELIQGRHAGGRGLHGQQ
nr:hypothetical protein [Paludibaculum fermentans]